MKPPVGTVVTGDCIEVMAEWDAESIDAICCDPPYGLEFMGKEWDRLGDVGKTSHAGPAERDVPDFPSVKAHQGRLMAEWHGRWAEAAYRVAKPSAYLLAFGGTRTVHRMTVALEDAGWIIRDMLVWAYASGFPKSRASLKPAWEPIVMARKPGPLRMLAIDDCRIGVDGGGGNGLGSHFGQATVPRVQHGSDEVGTLGRWPSNVVLTDELFESGVPGVVIAGSLTGTMTAWSPSPDSEPSHTVSPVSSAGRRLSRSVPGASFPASATDPAAMQLDAWATSTDTPKPDTGCSDGTTVDAAPTSGNTGRSGRTPTGLSRPDTSSTTETATGSTTDWTTSNSSPERSTTATIRPSHPESSRFAAPREPGTSDGLSDDSANWRRSSATAASRAGEPSADRRYTERGSSDFAPLPGERREVDGLGYSRFFLIPKADRTDREPVLGGLPLVDGQVAIQHGGALERWPDGHLEARKTPLPQRANVHPTVKPVDLMRHLVRLVTPAGGTVLDPFLGSGTTALACELEGFPWIGIEREAEYVAIAEARLNGTQKGLGLVG